MTETLDHRRVLGHYPTGVCAVTALVDGEPVGMVVGSFSSLSLDPPLVVFMPDRSSSTYAKLESASVLVGNILGSAQEDLCRRLASKAATGKWDGVTWHRSGSGAPILDEAVAWVECTPQARYDGGDHWIVVCRVLDLDVQADALPLVFFQGEYGRFSPASLVARAEQDLAQHVRMADHVLAELSGLTRTTGLDATVTALVGDELVVVAQAGPDHADGRRHVGLRIPFVPPFGGLFCAFDPEVLARWLGHIGDDADLVQSLRTQAERIRSRGWSLALRFPDQADVEDLLTAFTAGDYTPNRERRLMKLISSLNQFYEPQDLPSTGDVDVYSLRAPVFDRDGRVELTVQLFGPPRSVAAAELDGWRRRLLEATERMTRQLLSAPEGYAEPNLDGDLP